LAKNNTDFYSTWLDFTKHDFSFAKSIRLIIYITDHSSWLEMLRNNRELFDWAG